ncbi:cysteine desulfurase [Microbacteriaceae bacterium SG_E_30_P1]|uniref:Cysteine desulfurase n=1 Tax=Antiquaquibacter oligotrophicus TaxID=2880260 RepID=A0ABT6KN00_9MICO|nr:cysteine desulfurase family protein [Antiquaquibacter oligotrophicus]MDH6181379.1 cysteine desulfurase [Antiquaquibacter oligotrophicus]UDF12928.1 cysteine desulfurase [Antiquaquibacter oligotrophicus]
MAIYLDHAATTPMTPEVLGEFTRALAVAGNPSSIHSQGQAARRMLEEARLAVADAVGAETVEVTFTSGGTESINLALKGLFWAREGNRVLSTRAEHHATIDSLEWLESHEGAVIEWIPGDDAGRIDLDALAAALSPDVAFVTTLLANNEVGTIQPVREIVELASAHGVPVHVDAVSAFGSVPIDFAALGAAAMSVSAHKVGGPVGVGALVLGRGASVTPLLHGGNQQRARSGTMDAAGAHAFGVAATAATRDLAHLPQLAALRDRLVAGVQSGVPTAVLRGDPVDRLPGNAHFTFPGCEGDSLLFLLDAAGFSVSTGSACQAGVPEASHVLLAMGLSEADARGALRFTLGHTTTADEVDALVAVLPGVVERAHAAGLS